MDNKKRQHHSRRKGDENHAVSTERFTETIRPEPAVHQYGRYHAGHERNVPRRHCNGYSKKNVKTQLGEVEIKVPRDRQGNCEPKIIGKYNRNADGMEEKILALYACGMSQRDIAEQIRELYDVEISPELVTKIIEKIMPEVTAWQNRPLEKVYPFVFMDAIHYKVKEPQLGCANRTDLTGLSATHCTKHAKPRITREIKAETRSKPGPNRDNAVPCIVHQDLTGITKFRRHAQRQYEIS